MTEETTTAVRPAAASPVHDDEPERTGPGRWLGLLARVVGGLVVGGFCLSIIGTAALVVVPDLLDRLDAPAFRAWRTVLVAVALQGMPFLLLGTVVPAAIGAFVPARVLSRLLPGNPALAVPVAGAAGAILPGCECASVPVAASLMRRGVAPAAALAFLLSAPAINPAVLVATSIAFPGRPEMVFARLLASLATSMVMGWMWIKAGRPEWLRLPPVAAEHQGTGNRLDTFRRGLQHDFLHAGGGSWSSARRPRRPSTSRCLPRCCRPSRAPRGCRWCCWAGWR